MRLSDLQIIDQSDPNFVYGRSASRNAQPFSGLVVHHTADKPIENLVNYGKTIDQQRGGAFGYHFYVGKDGQIIQGAPLDKRTNHIKPPKHRQRKGVAGISNANAVGITLVGGEHGATPAQRDAAARLGQALMAEYGIGADNVFGHGDLQHDRQHQEGAEVVALLRNSGGANTLIGGTEVTDPALLDMLNAPAPAGGTEVTDPAILEQLNAPAATQAQPAQPAAQRPEMPPEMVEMPGGYVLDANAVVEQQMNQGQWPAYITGMAGNFLQGAPFLGEYVDEAMGAVSDGLGQVPGLKQALARAFQKKFAEMYPNSAMAAQVAGGVTTTAAALLATRGQPIPMLAAAAPASTLGQVGMGAGIGLAAGATEGAVSGFGAGQGGVDNRVGEMGNRAAIGGLVGAPVGAAAPVVSKIVGGVVENLTTRNTGRVARSEDVSPAAVELTGRMIQNDGGAAAVRNLDAPDAMLADTGPATAGLLDATIQKAGPGGAVAREAIADRAVAASKDINVALNDAFGRPPPVAPGQRGGMRIARTKRITNKMYDRAYAKPIDYAGPHGREIENLLERVPDSAFAEADKLMKVEGVESAQKLVQVLDDGSMVINQYPDVRQLDYITRSLNDIAKSGDGKGVMGGNTNMGRVHANLAREIRGQLRQAVPEWGQAVNRAASEISIKEARELGEVAMASRTTRGDLFEAIEDMGDAELKKLREGVRANIDDTLANVKRTMTDGSTEAREGMKALKDLSGRASQQKLEMILGKREAAVLTKRLDKASRAFELRARTADNSKTFARQSFDESIKDITEPGALGTLLEGHPARAAQRLLQSMTNMTPVARREVEQKLAGDIAQILTKRRGKNAGKVLKHLIKSLEKDDAGMALAAQLRQASGVATVVGGDQTQPLLQNRRE